MKKLIVMFALVLASTHARAQSANPAHEGYTQIASDKLSSYTRGTWALVNGNISICNEQVAFAAISGATSGWTKSDTSQPVLVLFNGAYGQTGYQAEISTTPDFKKVTGILLETMNLEDVNHGDVLHPDVTREYVTKFSELCTIK